MKLQPTPLGKLKRLMTSMNKQPLKNITILNTRPTHQSKALSEAIAALGGKTIVLPTIEIIPKQVNPIKLDNVDIAIFVSANAVHLGLEGKAFSQIPSRTPIIAIGPGTASTLKQYDITNSIIPEQYNSDGILLLAEMQNIDDKNIIIFCGENARPLLKETLIQRDAKVTLVECYRRQCPTLNKKEKQRLLENTIDIIISTSKESLNNLYVLLGDDGRKKLLKTPLLVISSNMKKLAKTQAWQTIITAPNASNQAIVNTIARYIPSPLEGEG